MISSTKICGSRNRDSFRLHYLKPSYKLCFTFALGAVVIRGNGLFFEKVLNHAKDVSVVVVAEVDIDVPDVVECYRLVAAGAAHYF